MVTSSAELAKDNDLLVKVFTPSGCDEHRVMQSMLRYQILDILNASGIASEVQFRILNQGNLGNHYSFREGEGGFDEDSVMVVISNGSSVKSEGGAVVRFGGGSGWQEG